LDLDKEEVNKKEKEKVQIQAAVDALNNNNVKHNKDNQSK